MCRYMRLSAPPVQRSPWPKFTPAASSVERWARMLGAVGRSPKVVKNAVSKVSDGSPNPSIDAPPVALLLSQPRPSRKDVFEQGQLFTPSQPAEHILVKSPVA